MSTEIKNILEKFRNVKKDKIVPEVFPLILTEKIERTKDSYIILVDSYDESTYLFEHFRNFLLEKVSFLDTGSNDDFYKKLFLQKKFRKNIVTQKKIKEFKFPEKEYIEENGIVLEKGQKLDVEKFIEKLETLNFERVDNVFENGEFAVRGFIIDLFPYGDEPYRIELDGENIESIRRFSLDTQLSLENVERVFVPPDFDIHHSKVKDFESFFSDYRIVNFSDEILKLEPDFTLFEPLPVKELGFLNFLDFYRKNYPEYKVLIFSSSKYEKEKIEKLTKNQFEVFDFNIFKGFIAHKFKEIFINDFELFKRERSVRFSNLKLSPIYLEQLDQIENGDLVVHQTYGIGIYAGIEKIEYNNRTTDCLKIIYAENDKLFVPVEQIYLVDKYVGDKGEKLKLSSLRSNSFIKEKERIKKSIKTIAGELLRLYAERNLVKGFSFKKDDLLQLELEENFEYEETEDQLRVIEEVKRDMEKSVPMDRLVVGEVGYGKTEVALRASFKAVLSDKQVAFLVPTTILAQQHYETFISRLKDFGVVVEVISRFKNDYQKRKIKEDLKDGKIDIIIGTHALLSKGIEFKDLGLLIIDEEHRFGVKQKEKLKILKKNIDVLSLSATPIPRTLEMSLMGVRDISSINTPPYGRKNIKTSIIKWDDNTIRFGILKEIERGGQVYFINNRIENIKSLETHLIKILPEIKIITLHAKMSSKYIDLMMHRFKRKEFDVLLSTSIIESGIDNPNVNTIFINNADKFGLAELHQLRGRVGRSEREAFCYLIIQSKDLLTDNAKKRISVFSSYPSLGAGLSLAMKDIEIRGAGKILGTEQHGYIGNVGYSLYFKLLNEAMEEIKGKKKAKLIEPTINIPFDSYISENYNITRSSKIKLYRSINSVDTLENLEKRKGEVLDIYGKIYYDVENLFKFQELKILCKQNGISKIEYINGKLIIEFYTGNDENRNSLIKKILSKIEYDFEIFYDPSFTIVIKLGKEKEDFKTLHRYLKKILL
ncbi:MAG: Transcription-repair coupling factor [candidate division TA06 bacterium 32_111]|uniref:Transcription-repair-coupling factor n=2 Tax=Bacteria candidate phyla TaxID=1783234 RepID=A0A101I3G9_UNCT6|nr:MAG: Transcription-repair coupling factor [candidate division TA06 bacterium 32_111]KUK87799.1 MAG: Transcription-repair coupling factor [candidate division TA06 bacterium 34_109]HAF07953.1 transcription-repair coupling factor [candidate division WOR-3 bacterium]HCP16345.1 transcription-repair coupling factor [candidate division WOR-3 bacterium]